MIHAPRHFWANNVEVSDTVGCVRKSHDLYKAVPRIVTKTSQFGAPVEDYTVTLTCSIFHTKKPWPVKMKLVHG